MAENSEFQTPAPRQKLLGVNFTPSRPCPIPQSHLNLLTQIKEGQSKKEIQSETPESFSHSSKRRYVRESAGDTGSEGAGARGDEESDERKKAESMRHNPDFKHVQINLTPLRTAAHCFSEKPETH